MKTQKNQKFSRSAIQPRFKFLPKKSRKPSLEHLSSLKTDLSSRIKNISRDRSDEASLHAQEDFNYVLQSWGMTEADIPHVISSQKRRGLVFLMLVVLGAALLLLDLAFTSLFLQAAGFVGLTTTLWRISILLSRKFIPFWRWIFFLE